LASSSATSRFSCSVTFLAGDVVATDNLRHHKLDGMRAAIEGAGCRLLYLPPCSPDLIPIGKAFSKLKALLRDRGLDGLGGRKPTYSARWRRRSPPKSAATTSPVAATHTPHLTVNRSNCRAEKLVIAEG
jgi:hypothetical protein